MTYSAYCAFSASRAFPQASHFSTAFYTPPERADEAVGVSRALVQGLADQGPTDLEMEVVRKQFADIVTRVLREPKYWCRVLSDFHYHRTRWEDLKSLPARVAASSQKDLRRVLRKYIVDEGRFEVICLPGPSSKGSTS
jgi:predicted Zn-dependent peptidase